MIVRKWAIEGLHPFPIALGQIDDQLTLIPLNTVCDFYFQLTDQAIRNSETNIQLAWAAVTLGDRLLVGLCRN